MRNTTFDHNTRTKITKITLPNGEEFHSSSLKDPYKMVAIVDQAASLTRYERSYLRSLIAGLDNE